MESLSIIPRVEWGARDAKPGVDILEGAVEYAIIHHSALAFSSNRDESIRQVRAYQNFHIDERKWNDIGYNFVVDEQGLIFEGRGWLKVGAHALNYNAKSIGICVIGDFMTRPPSDKALEAVKNLIEYSVKNGYLKEDYLLKGHRDTRDTSCPGDEFYKIFKTWPHFG